MSHRLNLERGYIGKGLNRESYRRLLSGLLRVILWVETMAYVEFVGIFWTFSSLINQSVPSFWKHAEHIGNGSIRTTIPAHEFPRRRA